MKKNAAGFSEPLSTKGKISFLRKGVVGDWKNYFTPELNEKFENEVKKKKKHLLEEQQVMTLLSLFGISLRV